MKAYAVIYYSRAEKELCAINKKEARVIFEKISQLKNNPHPQMSIKMKGYEYYRLRAGKYRVIYQIDNENLIITVISIKHRSDAYDNLQ